MPKLRTTVAEDIPGIQALIAGIYAEYHCVLDLDGVDAHLRAPAAYFCSSGGEFWVVDEAGEIRATCGVLLHQDAGELRSLYVHPSLRRQGWGRRLTELAIDYARRACKPRMLLWTDTRFTDAHRLYRKMGFTQFGTRDLKDSNNTTEYGFELSLT
jgi:GNAT superfamily N-acetyltransferase